MIVMKYMLCIGALIGMAYLALSGSASDGSTRIVWAIMTGAMLISYVVIESAEWLLNYQKKKDKEQAAVGLAMFAQSGKAAAKESLGDKPVA